MLKLLLRVLPSLRLTALESLGTYLPRVLRLLRPHRWLVTASVSTASLVTLIGLLTPWPLKILVDSALGDVPAPAILDGLLGSLATSRGALVLFVVVAQLGLVLVLKSLGVLASYLETRLDLGMTLDFRSTLFQHAQRLSLPFHDKRRSGMVLYKINNMDSAPTGLLMSMLPIGQNLLTLVGMFWVSFLLNWRLALLSLVVVPFLYYALNYYAIHIKARLYQVRNMEGETISIIHESLAMVRVIVAFGREDHEHQRLRDQGERAKSARLGLTVRQTLFSLVVTMTTASGTAMVLGLGAYEAIQGRLTVGELLIIMTYIGSVYEPIEALSAAATAMQEKIIQLQMAFGLLDTEPEVKDMPGAVAVERAQGQVVFDNVWFSYEGRKETLKGISFEVPAGRATAIVGRTGAGKTTLASLIPRFYNLKDGRVLLDGVDIKTVTIKSLRQQISLVLQEALLFSTTIEENIRYGQLTATTDEVVEAAKAANAHDFIMALPQKYETSVGERGAQLSGGERQRIGIARAFLKDAPILILDEPTSSIDSKTETVVLDALDRLMHGRTTFLIAHRLSTLRSVDHILVLHRGELTEQGTHEELLKLNGTYRQLYDIQTGVVRRRVRSMSPSLGQIS